MIMHTVLQSASCTPTRRLEEVTLLEYSNESYLM